MKMPTVGTIGSIALLGGIGYVAYKFLIGDWKIPSLPSIPIPTPHPETLKETGVVGGVGDIIYNITTGSGELRERVTERADVADVPFSKAVAEVVSEDIHEQGLGLSLLKAPVTIGAGLGAITQQERYYETLTPVEEEIARKTESVKRLEFQRTPEGMLSTALTTIFPPLGLITSIVGGIDIIRATTPTSTPPSATTPPSVVVEEPPIDPFIKGIYEPQTAMEILKSPFPGGF